MEWMQREWKREQTIFIALEVDFCGRGMDMAFSFLPFT